MKLKQRALALCAFCALVVISTILLRQYLIACFSNSNTSISAPHKPKVPVPVSSATTSQSTPVKPINLSKSPATVPSPSLEETWNLWQSWVNEDVFYPAEVLHNGQMNHLLKVMAEAPIVKFGIGERGTQLKASVILKGQQKAVFKPRRYSREYVVTGEPYAGFDRHNGEIAGFFLDSILGFRLAPPVVGRKVNLSSLIPVTDKKLLDTYFKQGANTCFYGECYYCKKSEAACGDGEVMEGSLTLWLPEWYSLRMKNHPYQRTYRDGLKARWEIDGNYCRYLLLQKSSFYYYGILEFTDTAIYDFLMGNADRHHYETYSAASPHGKLVHIDNGKTFGNPHHDEMSILAPLKQCCRVRRSLYNRLLDLRNPPHGPLSTALSKLLRTDPLYPILTEAHLQAIDRRHQTVLSEIKSCIERHSQETVLVDYWS